MLVIGSQSFRYRVQTVLGLETANLKYHVKSSLVLGEKHFFLIRPSPGNLSLYERWMRLTTQSETFLGDMVDRLVCC